MEFTGFGKGALTFFEELASNNNRQWWLANRERYESEIRAPLEVLLAELAAEFGEAKVFRPNRDVRFSTDKSPYKTQAAAVVGQLERRAGVLYMALSAEGLVVGGGCYMPASDQLSRLRAAIDDDRTGPELESILADIEKAGAEISAKDRLKTAPKGYTAQHPRIELLRMKGIVGMFDYGTGDWLYRPVVMSRIAEGWRSIVPLNRWLDDNVGATDLPPRH